MRGRCVAGTSRRSLVFDAQATMLDFQVGAVVTAEVIEPVLPAAAIGDAILEAELVGFSSMPVRRRRPSHQRHCEL